MCYAYDASPPLPPLAGGAADSEDLVLSAADGTRFAAFAARSAGSGGPGIVVMPDVRGLFRFYEELALRFAEQGVSAVAIDYFGRTAGVSKRDADFPFMEHIPKTTPAGIAQDVAAAVAYLRSPAGGGCSAVFTVGFCFGGSASWLQAAEGHGLAGAIGFYGGPGPSMVDRSPGPLARLGEFKAPILALIAGADAFIPAELNEEFRKAAEAANPENEVV
ncbi:MAG TPA: dienelactone hydrolase family protein, partial [Dehalococcoidia bacterium]|nr:dienelactone hydrolase family protein [Dehalococcoidia bacterium]